MTDKWKNLNFYWGLDNIRNITLLKIDESKATIRKQEYMESGEGKFLQPQKVKIFWVEWDEKLIEPKNSARGYDGEDACNFILIKMTKDSPWLINDIGH